jgi:teichuronic acid exporter
VDPLNTPGLQRAAAHGVAWSAAELVGQRAIGFVISIALARLLAPEQFGLLAMVTVFIAIASGMADAGFGQAIIQRQQLERRDLSSVFYFNLVAAALLMGILYLIAPAVSRFYSQPELIPILRWLSLGILIDAFGRIHHTQFLKQLAFRQIMQVTLPANLIGGGVGVWMAWQGYGVWALVGQSLAQRTGGAALLWWKSDWRPTLEFGWANLAGLFPYGSRLALSGLIAEIFKNLYVLVIGRLFGVGPVGYYHRAVALRDTASHSLGAVLGRVTFPLFCKVQHDLPRLRRGFCQCMALVCLLSFPMMAVVAGLADSLIVTLIGEKWIPAILYLRLLCVGGALYPLHAINLSILKSLGHSRLFLRLEIIKKLITVGLLAMTYRHGITVIILGGMLSAVLGLYINSHYTNRFLHISLSEALRPLLLPLLLALGMFAVTFSIDVALPAPAPVRLALGLIAALAAGLLLLLSFRVQVGKVLEPMVGDLPVLGRLAAWARQVTPAPVRAEVE